MILVDESMKFNDHNANILFYRFRLVRPMCPKCRKRMGGRAVDMENFLKASYGFFSDTCICHIVVSSFLTVFSNSNHFSGHCDDGPRIWCQIVCLQHMSAHLNEINGIDSGCLWEAFGTGSWEPWGAFLSWMYLGRRCGGRLICPIILAIGGSIGSPSPRPIIITAFLLNVTDNMFTISMAHKISGSSMFSKHSNHGTTVDFQI